MGDTIFKKYRESAGISQQDVAVKMGLSLTAYRNKEKGRSKFYADEIGEFCKIIKLDKEVVIREFFLK